jgi:hypothetical protein
MSLVLNNQSLVRQLISVDRINFEAARHSPLWWSVITTLLASGSSVHSDNSPE